MAFQSGLTPDGSTGKISSGVRHGDYLQGLGLIALGGAMPVTDFPKIDIASVLDFMSVDAMPGTEYDCDDRRLCWEFQ